MADGVLPMPVPATIEVDDNLSSDFENLSAEAQSGTTSICSSVTRYRLENGRRYHAYRDGAYFLPNDKREQERMELQHRIYRRLLDGRLYLAPLTSSPSRVLDLGTGTGCWAVDFADQHPSSQVFGNDLSPIQRTWMPPNCTFDVDDFESEWPYDQSRRFDYIHARDIAGSVGDYDKLFERAYQNLNPGGYLELQDFEIDIFSDDESRERAVTAVQWQRILAYSSEKFGKPLMVAKEWKEKMIRAGFTDVVVEIFKIPLAPWAKDPSLRELGSMQARHMDEVLESYSRALFTRIMEWSTEELDLLLAGVRTDLANPTARLYGKIWVVYGRKPEPLDN
ncbi:hypothetical protein VTO42DRAFT_8381 [Malbranchea cinnamomea]